MAKSTMGLGKFSGKVGGVVFAIMNGVQVARAYQPVVANPKSEGQRLQRAKGNLVGRISAITPWQILTGLGSSRRMRRSRFMRILLQRATSGAAAGNPNIINAKLAAADFVFSEGAVTPVVSVTSLIAEAYGVRLTISRLGGVPTADFAGKGALVVVTILDTSGKYERVFYRYVDGSEVSSGDLNISFQHIYEEGYTAAAYIAPFQTLDGSSLRARADELFGDGADFAASMAYNPAAVPLIWGNSELIRTADYEPAP